MALLCASIASSQDLFDESVLLTEIQQKTEGLVSPRQSRDLIRGITPSVTFTYPHKKHGRQDLFHLQSFSILKTLTLKKVPGNSLPEIHITTTAQPLSVVFVWEFLFLGVFAFFVGMLGLCIANLLGTEKNL